MKYLIGDIGNTSTKLCILNEKFKIFRTYEFQTYKIYEGSFLKKFLSNKLTKDLNKVFTPSDEKIAKAKKITKIFEEANTGLVMVDGKLIEKPVLREMYRTLAIAEENK